MGSNFARRPDVAFTNGLPISSEGCAKCHLAVTCLDVYTALLGLRQESWAIPMVFFVVWNPRLFPGQDTVPKRSAVLLAIATLLDIVYFGIGWEDGIAFQGVVYTYSVFIWNAMWMTCLWLVLIRGRRASPSFRTNLLFHWMLFTWFAWHAFPLLGELP
jgi:hypothetical protein